jgi:TRAP-type C4-dicarboxylate transport system permease small subunit
VPNKSGIPRESAVLSLAEKAVAVLHRLEDGLLIAIITIVILMASSQIILRNFFDAGISWGDVFVRNLVLWIGLVGAMVASRENKHIRVEALARYMSAEARRLAESATALFAGGVCTIAAIYGVRFTMMEYEFAGMAFAQIPTWACVLIIPVGFAVIALRFFFTFYVNLKRPPIPLS